MALNLGLNIQSTTAATRTNTTCTKPTSTASGDLLVGFLYYEGGVSVTPPSGWTQIQTVHQTGGPYDFTAWYKVAGGSEGTNYTWNHASAWTQGAIQRVTGQPATNPLDGTATTNQGNSATATGLGLSTTRANSALFLAVPHFTDTVTLSGWSSPLTERLDATQFGFASGVQATGGDSGNKTATPSASDQWGAILFGVIDASVATPKSPPPQPRLNPLLRT